MQIEVTQFIPPRGRQEQQTAIVADDCAVGYEAMKRHGCRLTVERLSTGAISLCIEHTEGDYAMELVFNQYALVDGKSPVQVALEKMLREFDGAKFERWLKIVREGEPENEDDENEDGEQEVEA